MPRWKALKRIKYTSFINIHAPNLRISAEYLWVTLTYHIQKLMYSDCKELFVGEGKEWTALIQKASRRTPGEWSVEASLLLLLFPSTDRGESTRHYRVDVPSGLPESPISAGLMNWELVQVRLQQQSATASAGSKRKNSTYAKVYEYGDGRKKNYVN